MPSLLVVIYSLFFGACKKFKNVIIGRPKMVTDDNDSDPMFVEPAGDPLDVIVFKHHGHNFCRKTVYIRTD